jgi:aryl-alcohol dehydrogenase-like predicted oxidoreductase
MELRQVGNSGLRVSPVGLGCNNFGGRLDLEATRAVVDRALDVGIDFFDTADAYGNRGGSESLLGECLGKRRKGIVLASKFGAPMDDTGHLRGGARRYILNAVEDSLRRLRTDWIDLYQFHYPDPHTPIEETLRALDDLVRSGKVRYIGWSNVAPWQLADAIWHARDAGLERFVSVQAEYSLIDRQAELELIPAARHFGIGILPFYPLAGGMLTGKYRPDAAMPEGARLTDTPKLAGKYFTDDNWARVGRLESFCTERGKTLLDLAFAWLLANPAVPSVIAGATKPEQIDANLAAGTWKLTPEDYKLVNDLLG